MNDIGDELLALLKSAADELGDLGLENLDDARAYAAERARHLASIVSEPGFDEAVIAERDAVLLRLGISAVDTADGIDQRVIATVHTVLRIAAKALSGGLV